MLIITFSTCFSKQITPPNPRSEIYAELTSGEKAFREASKTQLASSTKNIREKTELTEKSTSTMGAAFRELLPLAAAHGIIGQQPSMSENRTSRGIIEIQRLVARAEKEPESAYLLGLFYLYGLESLSPDEEAAIGWFRKAAVSGHNDAQCAIGLLLYSLDKGVATSYFQLASNDGHSYGHWLLGRSLYEQASGKKNSPEHTNEVNQLLEEAAVLFDLVAGEIPEAAHLLAVMHEYGLIPQEQNESQKSLQPSSSAWNFLRAAELYQQNSKRGFVESTFHLGLMYAYGRGLPQDYMRAAELFKRAATNHQQPHAPSMRYLAIIHANGSIKGIKNFDAALHFYQLCVTKSSDLPEVQQLCISEQKALSEAINDMRAKGRTIREEMIANSNPNI